MGPQALLRREGGLHYSKFVMQLFIVMVRYISVRLNFLASSLPSTLMQLTKHRDEFDGKLVLERLAR